MKTAFRIYLILTLAWLLLNWPEAIVHAIPGFKGWCIAGTVAVCLFREGVELLEAVLDDLVTATSQHLKKGDKVRLTGLGILQVRARAARMGRNPATGEAIKIKASKKIAFRPAKELKESV